MLYHLNTGLLVCFSLTLAWLFCSPEWRRKSVPKSWFLIGFHRPSILQKFVKQIFIRFYATHLVKIFQTLTCWHRILHDVTHLKHYWNTIHKWYVICHRMSLRTKYCINIVSSNHSSYNSLIRFSRWYILEINTNDNNRKNNINK